MIATARANRPYIIAAIIDVDEPANATNATIKATANIIADTNTGLFSIFSSAIENIITESGSTKNSNSKVFIFFPPAIYYVDIIKYVKKIKK